MKTYFKIIFTVFGVICFIACESMLDVSPKSSITVASMWEDRGDAVGAMYGAYSQFRDAYGGNYHNWGDYRTAFYDSGVQPGRFNTGNLFDNTLLPDDPGTDWGSVYTLINDVNLILKYVPDIEFANDAEKRFVIGNAYFLRGFAYFYIARIWGDAPIITMPNESTANENLYPTRADAQSVFEQAGNDIEQALEMLPEGYWEGTGLASKEAANMLKADFYLWQARVNGLDVLNNANEAVDAVLNSSNFSLSESYEDVFQNDVNEELIFSIIYEQNESTNNEGFIQPAGNVPSDIHNNPVTVQSGENWFNITETYRDFLQEKEYDVRTNVTAADYTYEDAYFLWVDKYKGTLDGTTRIFDSDYRVYRLAEAILFKAEILNELGQTSEAIEYLNIIAERAYDTENYYPSSLSASEVDDLILDERLKEFSTEGKAWFDMIRFGQAFDRIATLQGKENQQNILLWPVSYNTINRNDNIVQTPGYN